MDYMRPFTVSRAEALRVVPVSLCVSGPPQPPSAVRGRGAHFSRKGLNSIGVMSISYTYLLPLTQET